MCRLVTTHLFSWASVSCVFFFFGEIVQHLFLHGSMLIVQCHTIPHDHQRWLVFVCSTYRSTRSFFSVVLAKAVHWKTIHRFADTVRFRGTSCFSRGGAVHANSLHVLHHSCRLSCFALETLLETGRSCANQLCHKIAKQEHFTIAWKRHGVNWVSEPCGRIGTESPDPLVRTCFSDVAQFSAWCCGVLRCFSLLVCLLQHLRVRCGVRQTVRGCSVVRSLASCPL